MIPLIDDYLRDLMIHRLNWLKNHSDQIPKIFGTLGKRSSLKNLTNYVKNNDIKVLLGYPKEPNQLPCYVLTLSGEEEISTGLGDNIDENLYDDDNLYDDEDFHIDVINMSASYRIEVWRDNQDLATYMYILAKWALFVSRHEMLKNGLVIPKIIGGDLEPVPDYFPLFVYRRVVSVSFQYENEFYETEYEIEEINGFNFKPSVYQKDI